MVVLLDLKLKQLDMRTTFLHSGLEEQIYVEQQREGFKQHGKENLFCKFKRSLYGLKQSPRQWYWHFDFFVVQIGYMWSEYDSCIYFRDLDNGSFILLMLYVEDMLIGTKNIKDINDLKSKLNEESDMKDLGATKRILGMEI